MTCKKGKGVEYLSAPKNPEIDLYYLIDTYQMHLETVKLYCKFFPCIDVETLRLGVANLIKQSREFNEELKKLDDGQ